LVDDNVAVVEMDKRIAITRLGLAATHEEHQDAVLSENRLVLFDVVLGVQDSHGTALVGIPFDQVGTGFRSVAVVVEEL
jgi:hypothetical protein